MHKPLHLFHQIFIKQRYHIFQSSQVLNLSIKFTELIPANINLFKVNNEELKKVRNMFKICNRDTRAIYWRRSGVFIIKFRQISHLSLGLKSKMLCICQFSPRLFRNIGEFGAKKYFAYHRTANRIQLFISIKGNFSGLFFFWTSRCKGDFPGTT